MDDAVGDMGQTIAVRLDDAPAGVTETRVESEEAHEDIACDAGRRSGAQTRHDVVGDLEIGEDVLHVVTVLEGLEQLEERLGDVALDADRGLRPPGQARRFRWPEALFERVAYAVQVVGCTGHDMPGSPALDIVGARIERRLEHRLGIRSPGTIDDLATAIEKEADAVRLAEIATGLGERGAYIAGGPVAVVGQRLDDDGNPTRSIALLAHLFLCVAVAAARAAL